MNILTYDTPHRKTQDLIFQLLAKGYRFQVIVLPFEDRKRKVMYNHRPGPMNQLPPDEICQSLDLTCIFCEVTELPEYLDETTLIAGAGILPKTVTDNFCVINSHPGYLPNVRGLDALKWAIYEGQPIGVTTHVVNSQPDSGMLIDRKIVPVYFEDSFDSIARRVYETEIKMLVEAIELPETEKILVEHYPVHGRMPMHLEPIMMHRLKERILKSKSINQ
jgi:phosphoribosylglycinamide formyltransferase-1